MYPGVSGAPSILVNTESGGGHPANNNQNQRGHNVGESVRRNWRETLFKGLQGFTRFWGIFTAIVLCGVGIDIVVHKHPTGYYFIGGGSLLFLLEITWVVGVFLQLCVRNDQHRIFRCWSVVQWFETWKKSLLYGPLGALPIVFPHKLWLSYVAGGQLISLAAFHLILSFKGPRRRRRKDRLLHPDIDSYESSRFEEVTEVLDDGLPEPMPGSSHSLSDSLAEQDTILEI